MNKHQTVTVTYCPPMPAFGVCDLNDHVHAKTVHGGQVPHRNSRVEQAEEGRDPRAVRGTRERSRVARTSP